MLDMIIYNNKNITGIALKIIAVLISTVNRQSNSSPKIIVDIAVS